MTLILTAAAAAIVTLIYFRDPASARARHLGGLALMYWGAALMWCVDGFAALAEGEPFVELSDAAAMADVALLGLCVIGLGIVVWLVASRIADARKAAAAA